MTIPRKHPHDDLLVDHAAGQLDLCLRILLEVHLAHCRECTERLAEYLRPAARWLEGLDGEPSADADWEQLRSRLGPAAAAEGPVGAPEGSAPVGAPEGSAPVGAPDEKASARAPLAEGPLAATPLPAAARVELPGAPERLRWLPLPASAARICHLVAEPGEPIDLFLATIPGGRTFPRHLHLGGEQVVVMAGGYADQFGHFDVGDFYSYPAGSEHRPAIDPDEPCWVVTRIEEGVRLSGWRGQVQRLAEAWQRRRARRSAS